MTPLVDYRLSLIERALREVDIDAESLKQAARATYCEDLRGRGRRRVGNPAAGVDVPGRDAGLRIVEFALAGPLDGPEAALAWERRGYIGFDAEASEEVLLDEARRYWLSDKLLLPTEADGAPDRPVRGGGRLPAVTTPRRPPDTEGCCRVL